MFSFVSSSPLLLPAFFQGILSRVLAWSCLDGPTLPMIVAFCLCHPPSVTSWFCWSSYFVCPSRVLFLPLVLVRCWANLLPPVAQWIRWCAKVSVCKKVSVRKGVCVCVKASLCKNFCVHLYKSFVRKGVYVPGFVCVEVSACKSFSARAALCRVFCVLKCRV